MVWPKWVGRISAFQRGLVCAMMRIVPVSLARRGTSARKGAREEDDSLPGHAVLIALRYERTELEDEGQGTRSSRRGESPLRGSEFCESQETKGLRRTEFSGELNDPLEKGREDLRWCVDETMDWTSCPTV